MPLCGESEEEMEEKKTKDGQITVTRDLQEMMDETDAYVGELPLQVRESVRQVLYLEQQQDFAGQERLCRELLRDHPQMADVQVMLGRSLYNQGKFGQAQQVFSAELRDFPQDPNSEQAAIFLGLILHEQGNYREAVRSFERCFPPKIYIAPCFAVFGDCLERLHLSERARVVYGQELERFEKSGVIVSAEILSGVFQRAILLDVQLANGQYDHDMALYNAFLALVPMEVESSRTHLAANISAWSHLMTNRPEFRPQFAAILEHVTQEGYLKGTKEEYILGSGWGALESYTLRGDGEIPAVVESFLTGQSQNPMGENPKMPSAERAVLFTDEYYMTLYYPEHRELFEKIADRYPHCAAAAQPFLSHLREEGAEKMQEEVLDQLLTLPEIRGSRERVRAMLEKSYQKALTQKKDTRVYLAEGETFRRPGKKIMPNDPCPCGSGKKYKNCHGRRR